MKYEDDYANSRSKEHYWEEVADMLDDKDEIIVGRVGIFWFPKNKGGRIGHLIY